MRGSRGHRSSDRRHRVSTMIFLSKYSEKKLRIRKNLKAAEKSQIKYFNNGCEQRDLLIVVCVSVCVCLCLCVTIRMSIRVGVNCSAFQKLENLEICFVFFKSVKINLRMKALVYILREWELTPTLHEHVLYTQLLTLQLLWLASCAFQGWIHVVPCHPLYIFRPTLVFPLNIFKKTRTHWMHLRPYRPGVKQTLKPAWIIIITIIMPRSVCSRVWQIPQTRGQNWVLQRPETKLIWNTKQTNKQKD